MCRAVHQTHVTAAQDDTKAARQGAGAQGEHVSAGVSARTHLHYGNLIRIAVQQRGQCIVWPPQSSSVLYCRFISAGSAMHGSHSMMQSAPQGRSPQFTATLLLAANSSGRRVSAQRQFRCKKDSILTWALTRQWWLRSPGTLSARPGPAQHRWNHHCQHARRHAFCGKADEHPAAGDIGHQAPCRLCTPRPAVLAAQRPQH